MTYIPTPSADQTRSFPSTLSLFSYLLAGIFFGVVLVKSEAASWYRIQEMFRFQSFHMYGLIGSAVLTGMLSTWLLRRLKARALTGQTIHVQSKDPGLPRYVFGGLIFGLGWGLAGVCPGPVFTLLGSGLWAMLIVLLFALLGTWLYGVFRDRLPH